MAIAGFLFGCLLIAGCLVGGYLYFRERTLPVSGKTPKKGDEKKTDDGFWKKNSALVAGVGLLIVINILLWVAMNDNLRGWYWGKPVFILNIGIVGLVLSSLLPKNQKWLQLPIVALVLVILVAFSYISYADSPTAKSRAALKAKERREEAAANVMRKKEEGTKYPIIGEKVIDITAPPSPNRVSIEEVWSDWVDVPKYHTWSLTTHGPGRGVIEIESFQTGKIKSNYPLDASFDDEDPGQIRKYRFRSLENGLVKVVFRHH